MIDPSPAFIALAGFFVGVGVARIEGKQNSREGWTALSVGGIFMILALV